MPERDMVRLTKATAWCYASVCTWGYSDGDLGVNEGLAVSRYYFLLRTKFKVTSCTM